MNNQLTLGILAAALLSGCAGMNHSGPSASTQLEARSGSKVAGTVKFMQHGDHVMAMVEVSGLKPGQQHGFHVHDKGDCSAPDGTSAAGHFNPTGKPHGSQEADHHGGDMPALLGDANGQAKAQFHLTGVTVADGPTSIVGRSVIVHKDPDDYTTQFTPSASTKSLAFKPSD